MGKYLKNLFLSLLVLVIIISPLKVTALNKPSFEDVQYTKASHDLKMLQSRLWIDHVSWTRSILISSLASLEDKDIVLDKLLRNQDDIGNSVKPYYGEDVGNKLALLLRDHIIIATQIASAAKDGDNENLEKYNKLAFENADDVAKLLSTANPNYSYEDLKNMLYSHIQFVKKQAVSRLNKDWSADIEAYDQGEDHMIMLADIIANGIIKQFPQKFK